jgi:hypothetical protein
MGAVTSAASSHRVTTRRPYVVVQLGVYSLAALLSMMACVTPPGTPSVLGSSSSAADAASRATATRRGELNGLTAQGLVDELARAGFATPHPLNTTAQECPKAGCEQSIITDMFRVKSFETTGAAEKYAVPRGLDQVGTIVVAFAPPLPDSERQRYWQEMVKLAQ